MTAAEPKLVSRIAMEYLIRKERLADYQKTKDERGNKGSEPSSGSKTNL
jgi:hypothetical protein